MRRQPALSYLSLVGALIAASVLVALSLAGKDIRPLNASLVLLLLTLASAATFGFLGGTITAVLSNLVMSYFFLAPVHDIWVSDPQHVGSLVVFLLVSTIGSSLLQTARSHAEDAEERRGQAEALLNLNRAMIGQSDPHAALRALCDQVAATFGFTGVAVLAKPDGAWAVSASTDGEGSREPTDEERDLAEAMYGGTQALMPVLRTGPTTLHPLLTGGVVLAVLRLDDPGPVASAVPANLLDAFLGEGALAFQRLQLARAANEAEALRYADEVKTALLSSIAHDLKTPLATIKTSTSSLIDESVAWSAPNRQALLRSIGAETDRLDKTISALLDLNRIESGAVHPILRLESLDELVEDALQMASGSVGDRRVCIDFEPVDIYTDGSLVRHAFANLIENAALYSRPAGAIRITAQHSGQDVEVSIEDEGPGIEPDDLPFVFNRFYTGRSGKRTGRGNGLGLAIVRGFVTACGGTVDVQSAQEGTRFTVRLPLSPAAQP